MSDQKPQGGTKLGLPTPADVVKPLAMQQRTFSFTGPLKNSALNVILRASPATNWYRGWLMPGTLMAA